MVVKKIASTNVKSLVVTQKNTRLLKISMTKQLSLEQDITTNTLNQLVLTSTRLLKRM